MNDLHAATDALRNNRIAQIIGEAQDCVRSLSEKDNSPEIGELETLLGELAGCLSKRGGPEKSASNRGGEVFGEGTLCTIDWWKQEEELRILRTAVEQNPSTIVITDLNGNIRYVNPAFEKITGYSRDEALGQSPAILKSGKQSPSFYKEMWATLAAGKTWNGFFHNKKKNGSFFWELAVIAPLSNEAGRTTGYIAIKQDMTPQKEAELRIKEVNSTLIRMQNLYNQTSALAMIGGWELEISTKKVQLAPIARRVWELQESRDITMEEMLCFCKDAQGKAALRSAIERTVLTCGSFDLEMEIVTAKSNSRWVRVVGTGELHDGICSSIYGAVQDITNQKNLQTKLENALSEERRQSRYIKDLTHSLPVAIFQKDLEGNVLNCNIALEELTGYTREEILSTPIEQRYGKEAAKAMNEEDHLLFEGKHPILRNERTVIHKSGKEVPVIVSKSLLHNENEAVIGIAGAIIDITEIKALENEFREATSEAERANRAKSNFLATMSHEIRTPLNAVIGMASLLEQTNIDDNQREYTHTIVSASETLLELISDILDYSKIESHKLELHCESFIFEDLFMEPINMFSQQAATKGIELSHYIDPSVPYVLSGDRVRIKQILLNLLSNAIKFTPSGEVTLSVEVKSKKDGQYELEFCVRDSGIGIPQEAQEILFLPFSQADSSITRHYGGTGLGLAICNQLVRLMGGNISVRSKVGFGSEFSFNVLLAEGELPKSGTTKRNSLNGIRMLVIDDMPINRQLLAAFGQKWGMRVAEADGVDSALALLDSGETFDCIIFDYLMPKMDGAELAAKFREAPSTASAKRILLSSINETSLQLPEGLFYAALTKPLRPSRLFDLLQSAFAETKTSTSAAVMDSIDFTSLRILVAEDNLNNRTVIRLLLKQIGCSSVMVENGALAVDALEKENFDIVILDVQMPVMDGISAMRLLCEKYAGAAQRPYFIALTANAFIEDEQFCLQAGFDRYMAKPVTLTQLREAIKQAKQPKTS